jgi:hypothetical protein
MPQGSRGSPTIGGPFFLGLCWLAFALFCDHPRQGGTALIWNPANYTRAWSDRFWDTAGLNAAPYGRICDGFLGAAEERAYGAAVPEAVFDLVFHKVPPRLM